MTTRQTPDAVREAEAREFLANAMGSKHWAGLVREGKDDNWGVIKAREAIAAILAALDSRAGDAGEVERLRKALERARSDLHLATLHGSVRPMWEEAKAARDRVHEALAATPMRDSLEPTTDDVRGAIHRLTVLAQKESDPPAITKAMIWAYLHGRTDVATPAPAVDDVDIDSPAARLDMVRVALTGIIDNPASAVPLARAGLDFCDLTEAQRKEMRGDA